MIIKLAKMKVTGALNKVGAQVRASRYQGIEEPCKENGNRSGDRFPIWSVMEMWQDLGGTTNRGMIYFFLFCEIKHF